MNSDPTGYFTLFEVSAVLNIQSKIKTASVSAAIGGLMSMMDALLGGERDPLKLVGAFASGAIIGAVAGAIFGKLTTVANAGGAYAKVALMTKLGLTSLGVGLGGISTIQSFSEGKNLQGIFRGISTAIGVHGLKKAFGSAMASFKGSGNSASTINTNSNSSGKAYYHVTTQERAQQIMTSGELGTRNNRWESRVFAWTEQPTKKQASIAGIEKNSQTVIKFNTNASFEPDIGNQSKSISNIVVQTTDGQRVPISITNVEIMGFKKAWWQFWKK